MTTVRAKTGKPAGRRSDVSASDRERIRTLYYDANWTAKRIREAMYPEISDAVEAARKEDTIRKIAQTEQRKKENPAPSTGGADHSTPDKELPACPKATS